MKAQHQLIIISSLLTFASCYPASYSKVKFVLGSETQKPSPKRLPSLNRNSRSFGHHYPIFSFPSWNSDLTDLTDLDEVIFPPPPITIYDLQYERGHITPDYSNGLDYPDPLLLTGKDALIAVKYLYGHELFYHQIPHVRALLRNQEQRRLNGLEGNHLGSNRPGSPFYRN